MSYKVFKLISRKHLILVLGVLSFHFSAFSNIEINDVNYHVDKVLLIRDYQALITNKESEICSIVSESGFIDLFNNGIKESFLMLQNTLADKNISRHPRKLKKALRLVKTFKHPVSSKSPKFRKKIAISSNKNHYSAFADFRGKWHGKWKDNNVNQLWLAPKYVDVQLGFENKKEIILKAFQTVFIGDGIGWNYTVEFKGKTFVLGFTYHFNKNHEIYLERPHLGFIQKDNAIVWLTKDHIYIEFICKNEKCIAMPLHYCISGVHFEALDKNRYKEAFQAIYTADKDVRPQFQMTSLTEIPAKYGGNL